MTKGLVATRSPASGLIVEQQEDHAPAASRALTRAQDALAATQQLSVDSAAAVAVAEEWTREVKAEVKELTAQRDRYLAPLKALIDTVKADFDPSIKTLERARDLLVHACVTYRQRVLAEQEQRRLAAAAAIEAQAPREVVHAALVAVAEASPTASKGTTYVDHYVARLVDASKVPAEYLVTVVDDAKVRAAVARGVREIPGFEIVNEPIMRSSGVRR